MTAVENDRSWLIDGSEVVHLIEIPGVYDGWSVAVLADGRYWNRWGNDAQDGPEPGYESRYAKTQEHINTMTRPTNPTERSSTWARFTTTARSTKRSLA